MWQGETRVVRGCNEEVEERLGQDAVTDMGQRRQNMWLEKLNTMDNDRLVRRVFEDEVEDKKPRGRPHKRWTDNYTPLLLLVNRSYYFACEQLSSNNLQEP